MPPSPVPTTDARSPRLVELDSLRGLAALAVVFYHLTTVHARHTGFAGEPSLNIWWGDNGVEVFFVISGFVIFMTLERSKRPLDFVVSRFSRLYPAYWAAILFTTLVIQFLDIGAFARSRQEIAANFTMLHRLPGLDVRDVDWSYWSLWTELLFYVAMLGLFVTGRLKRIEVYLVAALVLAVGFYLFDLAVGASPRGLAAPIIGNAWEVLPYAPLFVVGICLYRLWTGIKPVTAGAILAAALLTVALTLSADQSVAIVVAVAAFALILTGRAGFLRWRPLVWLGSLSYSLYLVHNFAGRAVIVRLEDKGWSADAAVAGAIVFVFAVAAAINRLVETPAQRWVREHFKRPIVAAQPSSFAPTAVAPA